MSQERIPKRNELNPKDTWATEDLFVSDEAWLTEFANCSDIPEKIAAYKGTLGESAGESAGMAQVL